MSKTVTVTRLAMENDLLADGESGKLYIDELFRLMSYHLVAGRKVVITGFGTFEPVHKSPKKKKMFDKMIMVEDHIRIRFIPSVGLREKCVLKRMQTCNEELSKNIMSGIRNL